MYADSPELPCVGDAVLNSSRALDVASRLLSGVHERGMWVWHAEAENDSKF